MSLLRALLDLSMNRVQRSQDVFHVFTEVRMVGGQYVELEDEFLGNGGPSGTIKVNSRHDNPQYISFTVDYTPSNKAQVMAEVEAALTAYGGPVARISRGPWLNHCVGRRYTRTRIQMQGIESLQQPAHKAPKPAKARRTFEYGPHELDDHYDDTDPITLEEVPLDEALYLQTNVPSKSKKVGQLWRFKGSLETLVRAGGQLKSPITRKPFTLADIKRLRLTEDDVPLSRRKLADEDIPLGRRVKRKVPS